MGGMVVGIDIGGSITKIVGLMDGERRTPMMVQAADPVASLFGAFGKFIDTNGLRLTDIEKIMITGVGASFITKPIYGIATGKVEEFLANGLGGLHLSALKRAIIISMGTGTALVKAEDSGDGERPARIEHIGGTGMGGGAILGLSSRMLNVRDIDIVIELAKTGDLARVDLMVGDITRDDLPGLPPDTTAANFGKISDVAAPGDIALGILNLVLQNIGMSAVFALKNSGVSDVVLIGNLSNIPQCKEIFGRLERLFGISFMIPDDSVFGTAFGAALAYGRRGGYTEIE